MLQATDWRAAELGQVTSDVSQWRLHAVGQTQATVDVCSWGIIDSLGWRETPRQFCQANVRNPGRLAIEIKVPSASGHGAGRFSGLYPAKMPTIGPLWNCIAAAFGRGLVFASPKAIWRLWDWIIPVYSISKFNST
jgi:hypothetical protein